MKRFLFSLVVLIGLAFSNVGYALPDVTTKKTEFKVDADTSVVLASYEDFNVNVNTSDMFGVYEMVKANAPEVFTDNAGATKVTLYGIHKDDAFKYLTEQKKGKNIYTSGDCFIDKQIAVSICRSKLAYNYKNDTEPISNRHYNALSTSGQINSISKKWIRSI
jgi:hypothetical protein